MPNTNVLADNLTTTKVGPEEFLIPRGANVTHPRTTPSDKKISNRESVDAVHYKRNSVRSQIQLVIVIDVVCGSTTAARDKNKSQEGICRSWNSIVEMLTSHERTQKTGLISSAHCGTVAARVKSL